MCSYHNSLPLLYLYAYSNYNCILPQVSELESSEGVPGLGGGDQGGFALWLTLLQVRGTSSLCFSSF